MITGLWHIMAGDRSSFVCNEGELICGGNLCEIPH